MQALMVSGAERPGDFDERFEAFDPAAWHLAHYQFSHPQFDTDWDRSLVEIDKGLTLRLRPQSGENRFAGASIRRQTPTHYGLYKARLRAARGDGIITGFFLYTGPAYGSQHDEIDWEIFGRDTTTAQVAWWKDGKLHAEKIDLGFDASSRTALYAIDWGPERIGWYVDGTLVFETREAIPTTPQRLFANVWAVDTPLVDWAGRAPSNLVTEAKAEYLSFAPAQF